MLHRVTMGYRGVTKGYRGLQEVTVGYKVLYKVTRGYKYIIFQIYNIFTIISLCIDLSWLIFSQTFFCFLSNLTLLRAATLKNSIVELKFLNFKK